MATWRERTREVALYSRWPDKCLQDDDDFRPCELTNLAARSATAPREKKPHRMKVTNGALRSILAGDFLDRLARGVEVGRLMEAVAALHKSIVDPLISPQCDHSRAMGLS